MTNKKISSLARVLDAAVELIARRSPDRVSIADIAAAARCSTATIYDVYGDKERMLSEVIERGHKTCGAPSASVPDDPGAALGHLLNFLKLRIEFLSAPRTAGLFKASLSRAAANSERLEQLFEERDPLPDLTELVERAIEAGDVQSTDATSLAYCILATVSFEPLLANLWFSNGVDVGKLIETAMGHHLTPTGTGKLALWKKDNSVRKGAQTLRNQGLIGTRVLIGQAHVGQRSSQAIA